MAPSTQPVKTCGTCEHASFGGNGTYCTLFHEDVHNEVAVAAECPEYDPTPWANQEGKTDAARTT